MSFLFGITIEKKEECERIIISEDRQNEKEEGKENICFYVLIGC